MKNSKNITRPVSNAHCVGWTFVPALRASTTAAAGGVRVTIEKVNNMDKILYHPVVPSFCLLLIGFGYYKSGEMDGIRISGLIICSIWFIASIPRKRYKQSVENGGLTFKCILAKSCIKSGLRYIRLNTGLCPTVFAESSYTKATKPANQKHLVIGSESFVLHRYTTDFREPDYKDTFETFSEFLHKFLDEHGPLYTTALMASTEEGKEAMKQLKKGNVEQYRMVSGKFDRDVEDRKQNFYKSILCKLAGYIL